MEMGQAPQNSIANQRVDELLPKKIELIYDTSHSFSMLHEVVDRVLSIASRYPLILCYTGDVLSVNNPSNNFAHLKTSLKQNGIDVRPVYSPLDALQLAQENPEREVIFFDIGFEKAAATNALAVYHAKELELSNFTLFLCKYLIPPSMSTIFESTVNRVQALLISGEHINAPRYFQYQYIVNHYRVPIIITNNKTLDHLLGIRIAVEQLESGRAELANTIHTHLPYQGNIYAHKIFQKVFENKAWQDNVVAPQSSWQLRPEYRNFDTDYKFLLADHSQNLHMQCQTTS